MDAELKFYFEVSLSELYEFFFFIELVAELLSIFWFFYLNGVLKGSYIYLYYLISYLVFSNFN